MQKFTDIPAIICEIIQHWLSQFEASPCGKVSSSSVHLYFHTDQRDFYMTLSGFSIQEGREPIPIRIGSLSDLCRNISVLCQKVILSHAKFHSADRSMGGHGCHRTVFANGAVVDGGVDISTDYCHQITVKVFKSFQAIPVRFESILHERETIATSVQRHLSLIFSNVLDLELAISVCLQSSTGVRWELVFRRPMVSNTLEGIGYAFSSEMKEWNHLHSRFTLFHRDYACELLFQLGKRLSYRRNPIALVIYDGKEMFKRTWQENISSARTAILQAIGFPLTSFTKCYVNFAFFVRSCDSGMKITDSRACEVVKCALMNIVTRNKSRVRSVYFANIRHNAKPRLLREKSSTEVVIPERSLVFSLRTDVASNMKLTSQFWQSVVVIGQFSRACIICFSRTTGEVFAIDQHAAHERVRFERFREELNGIFHAEKLECAELVEKIPLALMESFRRKQTVVCRWGFAAEIESCTSLVVHSVPSLAFPEDSSMVHFQAADICLLLQEMHHISSTADYIPHLITDKLILRSCRGAIMFGDKLSHSQCVSLLLDLGKTKQPLFCSHGRRSTITLLQSPPNNPFPRLASISPHFEQT